MSVVKKMIMGIALAACVLAAGAVSADEATVLKTDKDKVNYAIGVNMAIMLKQQGLDIDVDLMVKGLRDSFGGGKLLLSEEEIGKAVSKYQVAAKQKRSQQLAKASDDNRKAGEAFLAENSKKEGVHILPSGLQYKIIKEGNGKQPTDKDRVECNYRGTFIGGAEFDSSRKSGVPAVFGVAEVIAGWKEALQLMPTGSTWQIFVPSKLAYGERGKPGSIGPNMALIFEIELLGIK